MVKGQYFEWLSNIAQVKNCSLLLKKLFTTEFWWTIPFDANRADDGIQLRYRFGREFDIPDAVICAELDDRPCSLLELIVALALRCEESIMGDENLGNRTALWIHDMLINLGVLGYTNPVYDEREVNYILERFLSRQYTRTGDGGLFRIQDLDPSRDMRTAEIWQQAMWFIKEI